MIRGATLTELNSCLWPQIPLYTIHQYALHQAPRKTIRANPPNPAALPISTVSFISGGSSHSTLVEDVTFVTAGRQSNVSLKTPGRVLTTIPDLLKVARFKGWTSEEGKVTGTGLHQEVWQQSTETTVWVRPGLLGFISHLWCQYCQTEFCLETLLVANRYKLISTNV